MRLGPDLMHKVQSQSYRLAFRLGVGPKRSRDTCLASKAHGSVTRRIMMVMGGRPAILPNRKADRYDRSIPGQFNRGTGNMAAAKYGVPIRRGIAL